MNDNLAGDRNHRRLMFCCKSIMFAAVIAFVLAALILPGLTPPRTIVRKYTCQMNLKRCITALHTYVQDYDGMLPSSALIRSSSRWNKADFSAFATHRSAIRVRYPSSKTWAQTIRNYFKSDDVLFCPSSNENSGNSQSTVSYWWKTAIDRAWYGDGCTKPYRRLGDFKHASDQILLYEHKAWHFGNDRGLENNIQIDVAFLDAHVKTITIKNGPRVATQNPCAYGEPMYFNYSMEIRRCCSGPASGVDPGRYSDDL